MEGRRLSRPGWLVIYRDGDGYDGDGEDNYLPGTSLHGISPPPHIL